MIDLFTIIWSYLLCNPWITFCFINAAFYSFWTTLLFGSQFYQMVWLNATTNERINMDRYVEFNTNNNNHINNNNNNNNMSLSNEKFHNSTNYNRPYDHGIWRNLLDLIGLPALRNPSDEGLPCDNIYGTCNLLLVYSLLVLTLFFAIVVVVAAAAAA
ncbi:unnamed protein product [Schistosoma curassoni]|uniref:Ion_trans domain-containing protein n=1 Tax=Schistosoma curassoni TaxID=6186 RepID=A0A183K5C2_9TREM|nr:unnamed protein product [Schistosoma curassoni]